MTNTKQITEEGKELYEIGLHIVSSLAEEQVQEVFNTLKSNLAKHAEVTAEKAPSLMRLAYTITKHIDRRNQRFDTAYFAWIKCMSTPEAVLTIKEIVDANEAILRSIIVKTVENAEEAAERLAPEEEDEMVEESEQPEAKSEASEGDDEDNSKEESSSDELDEKIDELVK